MTTKHTPGPWVYELESVDPSWAIVATASGAIVANVNSETGPDATSAPAMRVIPDAANARLIASAPELLSALQGIIDYAETEAYALEELADCDEAKEQAASAYAAVEVARAAIAKATGEKP